jgi:ASC-1-like (ASCH) protein
MMTYKETKQIHMNLQISPFNKIKQGEKTIELRLYDEKRQQINIGDTIIFFTVDKKDSIKTKVVGLSLFSSFTELLTHLNQIQCGWDEVTTPSKMAKAMLKYYSQSKQQEYGVVGIHLELI